MPILRTLFGAKQRPGRNGTPDLSLRLAAVIETPRYDLTLFKLHFGSSTLKAYIKGEHVLRFEAVVHNTRALRCGRVLDNFPTIIARLAGMVDRFTTTLDCVDHTFIAEGFLDRLPASAQVEAPRVGGVEVNKPRIRAALSGVLATVRGTRGVHRRRVHRQGPRDDRARRLHHSTGRLRPAQTPRQGADRRPPFISSARRAMVASSRATRSTSCSNGRTDRLVAGDTESQRALAGARLTRDELGCLVDCLHHVLRVTIGSTSPSERFSPRVIARRLVPTSAPAGMRRGRGT